MNPIKKSFQYGRHTVTLETGAIARQATGSVMVRMDDTVVLVTVVGIKDDNIEGRDFFPLTVNYQERTYAAGRIPGGYFKREGRPTEKETLTSRLIDRPLRPLFPEGFYNEVQIVATVMSLDPEIDSDLPALIGASAALAISGIPFQGPVAAAKVGYSNGQYILNPTATELETSLLNLVVAGTENAVLMVESEAMQLPEEVMLGSVFFGHEQMQVVINAIKDFAQAVGTSSWDWQPVSNDQALVQQLDTVIGDELRQAYQVREKMQRREAIDTAFDKVMDHLCPVGKENPSLLTAPQIEKAFSILEKDIVRGRILAGEPRIDGRDLKTVRPITISTSVLPRTHGSALFTRGETQAIAVATLGTARDAQTIDALDGERKDTFMLHYNFPPYSVGEVGQVGAPKRREIGHGFLAKRAMRAVLPSQKEFPYVIRVVSEITESNGSSSMASVCGASLSLMDAGVPIKAPVAGIAMGLVKDGDRYAVLSDILGDEDHLGDMDFKVAGTTTGVTALQMDIKIQGVTKEIMQVALDQAKQARLHILNVMSQVISEPKTDMSDYAPRIYTMRVSTDKIRDVIGKGGVTIRGIIEETGVDIDINDEGIVTIASPDNLAAQEAIKRVERIVAEVEVGQIYEGIVTKIVDFGAFVNVLPGKDGLVHISQISHERIKEVGERLHEGQQVKVKVLEVDGQGRIRLSMKEVVVEEE